MQKPIIGVPGSLLTTPLNEFEHLPVTYTQHGLMEGLANANSLPFILPIIPAYTNEDITAYINQVDALVLAGGNDLSPYLYNQEPHLKLQETVPARDEFEWALAQEARKQKKPLLGICRGLQLINVLFGGTLYQDLGDLNTPIQHVQASKEYVGTHTVSLSPDSFLGGVFGREYRVNSYHHQGIHLLGNGLRAVAWSHDGLIEGIEHTDPTHPIVAMQWHPEWMCAYDPVMQQLFDSFVELVRTHEKTHL